MSQIEALLIEEITPEKIKAYNEAIRERMRESEDPEELKRLLNKSRELVLVARHAGDKKLEKVATLEYEKTKMVFDAKMRVLETKRSNEETVVLWETVVASN